MKIQTILACAAALTAAWVAPGASADNCSGYDVLVNQSSDSMEVAKGHSMTTNIDHSVVTTDDPKSIYNMTTGRCTGVFLALPDGTFTGSGFCLRKDKDGDTESISWELKPGADKGTWRSTAGTGKFAGKADSGWWQGAVTDGKMTVTRWGGDCK